MPSLDEILDKEDIVLIDTNILQRDDSHSFGEEIYSILDFSEFDTEKLDLLLASFRHGLSVMQLPNVRTIGNVADEIRDFSVVLGNKLSYVHVDKKNTRKYSRKQVRTIRINESKMNAARINEEKLRELQDLVYQLSLTAGSRDIYSENTFHIDSKCSDILLEITKQIDRAIELKPSKPRYHPNKVLDSSRRTDTDERLVVALYCLALYPKKHATLVSGDTDFVRLLGVLPKVMGAYEFMPYNARFRESLQDNPFKFYLREQCNGEFTLPFEDDDKIVFDDSFVIRTISNDENNEFKAQILGLWKDFFTRHRDYTEEQRAQHGHIKI